MVKFAFVFLSEGLVKHMSQVHPDAEVTQAYKKKVANGEVIPDNRNVKCTGEMGLENTGYEGIKIKTEMIFENVEGFDYGNMETVGPSVMKEEILQMSDTEEGNESGDMDDNEDNAENEDTSAKDGLMSVEIVGKNESDENYKEEFSEGQNGSKQKNTKERESREETNRGVKKYDDVGLSVKKVGDKTIFKCKICHKKFPQIAYFRRHFVSHTGSAKCRICQKVFKHQNSLDRHMRNNSCQMKRKGNDEVTEKNDAKDMSKEDLEIVDIEMDSLIKREILDENAEALEHDDEGGMIDNKESQEGVAMGTTQSGRISRQARHRRKSYFEGEILEEDVDGDESDKEEFSEDDDESDWEKEKEKGYKKIYKDVDLSVTKIGNKRVFRCKICHKTFPQINYFRRHYVSHSGSAKCNNCQRTFTHQNSLDRHIKMQICTIERPKKSGNSYECETCHKKFPWASHLRRHSVCHTESAECTICQRVFSHQNSLERHMKRQHDGEKCELKPVARTYKCQSKQCDEVFPLLEDRKKHEQLQHDGKPLECDICAQKFSVKCHLKRHMGIHTEAKECDICQQICKNESCLESHRKSHTQGKLMCQYCGKTFSDRFRLNTHEALHKNKDLFKCCHCNKCLSNAASLRLHMQRHTGYLYLCKHCGEGLPTKKQLAEHEAIHTGVKAHKCPICGECFRTSGQFFCHKVRHQEKQFACDVCQKKFRWKCDLVVHKDVHLNQRQHKCDHCDKAFNHISNKIGHMKQVHLGIKRTGHGKGRRSRSKAPAQKSNAGTSITMPSQSSGAESHTSHTVIKTPSGRSSDISSSVIRAPSHRLDPDSGTSYGGVQVIPPPRPSSPHHFTPHPLMAYHGVSGDSMMHPLATERGGTGQYRTVKPESDFYSMVETLIHFSKDN